MTKEDLNEVVEEFKAQYPTKFLNPNREKYYERFCEYCKKNNLEMNKNTAYRWLLEEAEKNHPDIMITNPNATKKDIEKDKKKMAEERESRGSNLIQLKVSDKAKEYLQERADSLGFPLNTYIYHLIMKDMETFNQK
ncbi:TPA: hypothetical protein R6S25_000281 [Campylobacter jejuni]|uniref:hypothetical protein n=1 Tax=Campylobacter jejuni TaxID=197 RepID=UPI00069C4F71|nr:hypothetical protein [Campylobacter jejuni]EAI4900061.1 hypothetical protein [Campylobacter jejuni]EAI5086436.1 hypothetical protein [Campylobacter jejuni]EAI5091897.1 hypothetical protein [Campylobacter jejuni]EAJ8384017.1 hypothetical protein [Campylobacter jejuni]EAK1134216.1 hypothetical protein [Campylobacter jejuni]